jgi:hypothetical protein
MSSIFYLEDVFTIKETLKYHKTFTDGCRTNSEVIHQRNHLNICSQIFRGSLIKKGDIISISRDDNHPRRRNDNDGTVIWDGSKAVPLRQITNEYKYIPPEVYGYGGVPRVFSVITEFEPNHWLHSIDYNDLVPFDHVPFKSDICKYFNFRSDFTEKWGKLYNYLAVSVIFFKQKMYKIIFAFIGHKKVKEGELLREVIALYNGDKRHYYHCTKKYFQEYQIFYDEYDFVEGRDIIFVF